MQIDPSRIRTIVFDLDGTLYVSEGVAREIEAAAWAVVARSRGLSLHEGKSLVHSARRRLTESLDEEPTLTRTCQELGITVAELHQAFVAEVHPERYLSNDPILYALLDSLGDRLELYLYTNNNLAQTRKILALLGVEDLFRRLYTIEYTWRPKPDVETLHQLLSDIGGPPESFLFVGDRLQVDLGEPARLGIPTLLVAETADLLQIHRLLGLVP